MTIEVMNQLPTLVVGVALLWGATVNSEEKPQPTEPIRIPIDIQYVEDQASPGKWYTCVQVYLGALMSGTEMTESWVDLIKVDEHQKPYVFARHSAIETVSPTQVRLIALFPGIHRDFNVAVGFDLRNIITEERRRIAVGRPIPLKEMDANIPMKMIPVPEQDAPATPQPATPEQKEKKSPSPRSPRKSIDGDFLQVLIG